MKSLVPGRMRHDGLFSATIKSKFKWFRAFEDTHCFALSTISLVVFLLSAFCPNNVFAQPGIEWDKTYGGNSQDASADIKQTPDGGYIVGGSSLSGAGIDKTEAKRGNNTDASDFWVLKLKADGSKEWDKTIGGDGHDYLSKVLLTPDGGYLLGGISRSDVSGEKTANHIGSASMETNKTDYWIVKLAADGTKQWDKTIGGNLEDGFASMAVTTDGGYILAGTSNSEAGANKSQDSKGLKDYWLVKITANGTVQWDKTIGGNNDDILRSIVQNPDGSYTAGGYSSSAISGDKTQAAWGNVDYWIVKVSSSGTPLWDKTLGGNGFDVLSDLQRTSDGGYIAGGASSSESSGDKTEACRGEEDYWIVKLSQNGAIEWQKTQGGTSRDYLYAVWEVAGGGYLVSGTSNSNEGADKTIGNAGATDCWLIKLAANGTKQWESAAGSNYYDQISSIFQTADGSFILTGASNSNANIVKTEDFKYLFFEYDIWIVKLVSETNTKKLSFSNSRLEYTNSSSNPIASQSVLLASNAGSPPVKISKSTRTPWIIMPPSSLGSLSFGIDKATLFEPGYVRNSIVTAVSPGYARAVLTVSVTNPTLYIRPIGNQTIPVNFTYSLLVNAESSPVSDAEPSRTFSLTNAPAGATINASTGIFTWKPTIPGSYTFLIKVASNGPSGLRDEEQITIKVVDPTLNENIRINAGGKDVSASGRRNFLSDRYFAGTDRVSSIPNGDILNTTDDALYRSGRCSPAFSYEIPMKNGNYEVILHFAEIWFGVPRGGPAGVGKRMFNVDMEGSRKLTNYDIYANAGGAMKAVQEKFLVTVTDQVLNLDFLTGSADLPRLSAIEVLIPQNTVILAPLADAYVRAGNYATENYGNAPTLDVKNGIDPRIKRTAYFKFSVNGFTQVTSAKLRVYGNNVEDDSKIAVLASGMYDNNWTENGITWYNAPAMNHETDIVNVNNVAKYYEFDVTNFIRNQLEVDKTITLQLKNYNPQNRKLTFNSKESGLNPPQLVIQTIAALTSGSRIGEENSENISSGPFAKSVVFPNPIRKQFTIAVSDQHTGNVSFQLVNNAGMVYPIIQKEKAHAGSQAEIDISGLSLSAGNYLLKVHSGTVSEVLKVLITD